MTYGQFHAMAAALDLVDHDATPEEVVMAARDVAASLPPAQALAPIRARLEQLRTEIHSEQDAGKRARLERAAVDLETLLRHLEHGHAPT